VAVLKAYYENGKQLKDGKGKRKICNLSRHNRDKFQERLDFKFCPKFTFRTKLKRHKLTYTKMKKKTYKD